MGRGMVLDLSTPAMVSGPIKERPATELIDMKSKDTQAMRDVQEVDVAQIVLSSVKGQIQSITYPSQRLHTLKETIMWGMLGRCLCCLCCVSPSLSSADLDSRTMRPRQPVYIPLPENERVQLKKLTLKFGEGMDDNAKCTVHIKHKTKNANNLNCIELELNPQAQPGNKNSRFRSFVFHIRLYDQKNNKMIKIMDYEASTPLPPTTGDVTHRMGRYLKGKISITAKPEAGLEAGGQHDQEVNAKQGFIQSNISIDDEMLRWHLWENEKLGSFTRGINQSETLQVFMKAPPSPQIKAELRLSCVYKWNILEETSSIPKGRDGVVDEFFILPVSENLLEKD
ncbi:hypothetical protein M422DRAFT_242108 [Sphaerobolus stellatus SS14]|nr:hypothetical protein M422DRAFT_242108 [Sphaerobolus stellatus SS14]